MNCLQSKIPKIPFTVLRMNCLQSKIPLSALLMNCYRRFPAKQSTILTAEYNSCSPQLIDPPSINHSTGVTGMRQPVRRVTIRAQSAIELLASRLNKLQKYDPVGLVSYRSVTLWAQSATEVSLSGPDQLQKCDLQGPSRSKNMTFTMTFRAQSALYVWPSGTNQLHM